MNRLSIGSASVLALFAVLNVASAVGDAESGERVYLEQGCYSCHGYNGIGRRQLANDASGFLLNEGTFTSYLRLRANLKPKGPANSMPNYSADVLNDQDAINLYAYIKTLSDDPPDLEDITVFMQILNAAQERGDDSGD